MTSNVPRSSLLRGQVAFAAGAVSEAPALLLQAARQLEPLDGALARQTYLEAWIAAVFAGRFAQDGNLRDVSRAARSAPPPPDPPAPHDLLLDGLAVLVTDGRAAAAPMLRRAARTFAEDEIATEEGLRWGWVTTISTNVLWDVESSQSIALRQVQSAREAGLLVHLLAYVNMLGILATWCGDFAAAASLVAEGDAIAEATGTRLAPYAAVILAGLRGSEADATRRIEVVTKDARATGQGVGIQFCQLVSGILYNGLGRYEKALEEARQASEQAPELYISAWALPELIEAASRTGQTQAGRRRARPAGRGHQRRPDRLGAGDPRAVAGAAQRRRGRPRPPIARRSNDWAAHPFVPSWPGRTCCTGSGCAARPAGPTRARSCAPPTTCSPRSAWRRSPSGPAASCGHRRDRPQAHRRGHEQELTAQEAQIARLARDGLSNPEIGARLFISARTVQYHLGKVFAKLEISSRLQLRRALPDDANAARLASGPVTRNPPL